MKNLMSNLDMFKDPLGMLFRERRCFQEINDPLESLWTNHLERSEGCMRSTQFTTSKDFLIILCSFPVLSEIITFPDLIKMCPNDVSIVILHFQMDYPLRIRMLTLHPEEKLILLKEYFIYVLVYK